MTIYLIAAYLVFWLGTSALLLSIWAKQVRIERDIKSLERRMQEDNAPARTEADG